MQKTIGLTGGIGSGKSTVAQMLGAFGAVVIHADAVGHDVYRPHSEGWRRVIESFGSAIVQADQTIDRKQLGSIVFGDPDALKRLNAIVHPLIYAEIERRIAEHRAAGMPQPIVLEAAILIEANWLPLVDEVWLVSATNHAVIERVATQRGLSATEIETRLATQLTDLERRRIADVVIDNTGSMADLRTQVQTAWDRFVGASNAGSARP